MGVDLRGWPPTRAERRDPRWTVGPHWSGLPRRVVGVVGLPDPGRPVPYNSTYRGRRVLWWPTPGEDGLRWRAEQSPVGWRMNPEKNCNQGCMGPGPRPKNPHIGFWWDDVLKRLGEVYDPSEPDFWW